MSDWQRVPFSGLVHLSAEGAAKADERSPQQLEIEAAALLASGAGAPATRVDFADVDGLDSGDYRLTLRLADGTSVEVSMLGRRFAEFEASLSTALRNYQARYLLMEESVGGESFGCDFDGGDGPQPAEVRVWATSLGILPRARIPFTVPFGELTSVAFDEERYAVTLAAEDGPLRLSRLGRQTKPLLALLEKRLAELRRRTATALGAILPQLPSVTLRRLAQVLPDGVPARKGAIDAIAPSAWGAMRDAAVDPALRSAFDALADLSTTDEIAVGLKETNARQDRPPSEADLDVAPVDSEDEVPTFASAPAAMSGRTLWYAFPLLTAQGGNAIAFEAVTRTGRATYLFRGAPTDVFRAGGEPLVQLVRQRVRALSRAMVSMNFRREPIHLSEAQLLAPSHASYRLALRVSAPLRLAREAFLGRATHGPTWRSQLAAALRRATD